MTRKRAPVATGRRAAGPLRRRTVMDVTWTFWAIVVCALVGTALPVSTPLSARVGAPVSARVTAPVRVAAARAGAPMLRLRRGHVLVRTARASHSRAARRPLITTQPRSAIVTAGRLASFTATASGTPAPAVQWQRSANRGRTWSAIRGAHQVTYAFRARTGQSGEEYRAVFRNRLGSATTASAAIAVRLSSKDVAPTRPSSVPSGHGVAPTHPLQPSGAAPVLTTQPTSTLVQSGATATFTAAASGTPAPTVQWEISTDGGGSWSPIAGATATSYSLTASEGENGEEYRAVFSNPLATSDSAAATLSVPQTDENWAGYAVLGSSFSSVSGSWTVPSVTCPAGVTTYSSQWIGIDGYSSDTVEQDGTEADCVGGIPFYAAWYEMYGENAVNDGWAVRLPAWKDPVSPGDQMTASVSVSGSAWTLAIADGTRGWSERIRISAPAPAQAQAQAQAPQRSSAEWILERPEVGSLTSLADVGTVSFTGASATDAATSGPISAFAFTPLAMIGSTLLATPGELSPDGESFSATWQAGS